MKRRIVAGLLAVMVLGQVLESVPVIASQESVNSESGLTFNNEGVWLTEIYQNDVDRSKEKSGYDSIRTYDTTEDLMEFLEITSTHADSINLNNVYDFYYGDAKLTVTDMDGNTDVTIQPGQSVVLWNYRSDLGITLPTEAEFREELRIPDDAVVLKITGSGNWKVTASFSIKTKDNTTVSTYNAVDKVDTQDGFSVELEIPDLGSEMQVYREINIPSAGYVYSGQLNGLGTTQIPDETYADGVYITEVRPNDTNRSSVYGTADDYMECLEIVNTTDHDVDLNNDYALKYVVKEGQRLPLTLYHYDETAENGIGSSEGCTIKAGETAVIWCYRINYLSGYTSFPTEAEFRAAYGISDEVPVYMFTNQNGLSNTNLGFELYQLKEDGSKELESSYCWVGNSDAKDNKSAILAVNPEGPEMLLYTANGTTTMGTVNEAQYTYLKDDGSALELELDDEVPESITQGEEIRVNFRYDVTSDTLPRTGITTYYRFDGEGAWYSTTETSRRVPNLYEMILSADELFDHDYVEFYVSADNRYRSTLSDIYKVDIKKLNEVDGIRTNISDGEEVSGTVSVTANDGADNANSKIYIDGVEYSTVPMFEDGAYFSFNATGRDSYFKNMLTTTEDEPIASIGKWQYTILDGQAIRIDNSYFTYNEATKSYDTTLRFWAGTYGATTIDQEIYLPTANREDFTVTELALKVTNGNTYLPTAIGPATFGEINNSAKTNLSTAYNTVHSIGDSAGMCPYMDVSFSVPEAAVNAVGTEIDTTTLSNGEHTLKVTNGTDTTEVKFIVDNEKPVIDLGIKEGETLTGKITVAPTVTDNNGLSDVIYTLDGEVIDSSYSTTAYELGNGEHVLSAYAEDNAGNFTSESVTFTVTDAEICVIDGGADNITADSASLYLTLENVTSDTQATFYKAEEIDAESITTNTESGILPYIQYEIKVGDADKDDVIVANWDGTASNSDDTHASTMYVLNTETGAWDTVAAADENGSIKEASFVAENHVKDGIATVIIQCTAESSLPDLDTKNDGITGTNVDWDGDSVPEDYDFCLAWETDTQYYAEEWQYHFLNMNQWIVDNAEEWKIKYVIHTGDIVDDYDMIYEWENADEAMSIFDEAGMPYGVLGGNHDVAAGLGQNENYYTYFGEDRFTSQPTYGESYENNLGHYDLISENGQDLIILYMSWDVYTDEINWMNEVLAKYSDRKAILCFHPYTNVKQSNGTYLDYYGQLIQEQVVAKNENVFAVLNGHYHGSSFETAMFDDDGDGVNDRTVYQICTDYQSGFEGGSEYIKFLYFDLDNNKIYMNSYSPFMNDFNYFDTDKVYELNEEGASGTSIDKMVLDVDFSTDEQSLLAESFSAYLCTNEELGVAAVDSTAGKATLNLSNLTSNTDYVWYAVLQNVNTGYLKTGLYEFTTLVKKVTNDIIPKPSTPLDDDNNKPTGNVTTGTNSAVQNSTSDVKTGDAFPIVPVVLFVTASGILIGLAVYKKKLDSNMKNQ